MPNLIIEISNMFPHNGYPATVRIFTEDKSIDFIYCHFTYDGSNYGGTPIAETELIDCKKLVYNYIHPQIYLDYYMHCSTEQEINELLFATSIVNKCNKLESEYSIIQKQFNELKKKTNEINIINNDLQMQTQELANQCNNLESEYSIIHKKYNEIKNNFNQINNINNDFQIQIEELLCKNNNLTNEIKILKVDKDVFKETIITLEYANKNNQEIITKLQESEKNIIESNNNCSNDKSILQKELEILQKKLYINECQYQKQKHIYILINILSLMFAYIICFILKY